uniref:PQQ-dependent sugar dehydrogenase n=1 Tax=Paraglaciecola marina TaxID=2500157 RepID=UPI00105D1F40
TDTFELTFETNVAPVVSSENHDQTAYVGVAFSYDISKNGTVFTDENDSVLIYSVDFSSVTTEVALTGSLLQGTFNSLQTLTVTVTATDDGGLSITDVFTINAIETAACHSFEAPTNSNVATLENVFEAGTSSESLAAMDFVYADDLSEWHMVAVTMDGIFTAIDLADDSGSNERSFGDISSEVGVVNIDNVFVDSQQAGVTSAVFAPKSMGNYIFVALNGKADSSSSVISRVLRYEYDFDTGIDTSTVTEVLSVTQSTIFHHIGKLLFDDNDYLLIGLGSGENAKGNSYPQMGAELRGKILRVDVSSLPYSIPADNPFVSGSGFVNPFSDADTETPREEIYAFGFRNPWEFSLDSLTNELWVGDVGQSRWEEINKVVKGGNYGWPFYEANEDYACDSDTDCVVSDLLFPEYDYNHSSVTFSEGEEEPEIEGVAVIGGVVYRGSDIPSLYGTYLFSDYSGGTLYGMSTGQDSDYQIETITSTSSSFYSYIEGPDSEVYILQGSAKNILKLVANTNVTATGDEIPTTLSATGCVNIHSPFESIGDLVPYEVTTPLWSDGAEKHRYISVPDGETVTGTTDFDYPVGTTFVKTFSFDGVPHETRLMVLHDTGWGAYTYQWDWENKEAYLLYDALETELDNGLTWTYPSRANCFACHTEVAERVLGFEALQLNRDRSSDGQAQIEWLGESGILFDYLTIDLTSSLSSITDEDASYTDRMKSYVHANCSYCHQPEGTAQAAIDFRYDTALADMGICDADALYDLDSQPSLTKIVDSTDYLNSILYWRIAATDDEKMPPIGRDLVDEDFLQLLVDWHNTEGTACVVD